MDRPTAALPPTLFLLVDAIPYDLARQAWRDGAMPDFVEPLPLVSVFPSLTNVAVSTLLRGVFDTLPVGYEARYYDLATGTIRGGFGDTDGELTLAPLHNRPRGFVAHVAVYLLRRPMASGQIRWITHRFAKQGGPWLAYLPATDGVAHFAGRSGLERSFRDVCATVARTRDEYRRETGIVPQIVMCSDHGMAFGDFEHLSSKRLQARFEEAGFQPGGDGRDRVVLVPFGDVGGGVAYTAVERAAEAAEIVARAPGVDVAFGRSEGGCIVVAARDGLGRARILWRDDMYRYEPTHGDPLGYEPVWEDLAAAGKLHDGWANDADLFPATWSHPYPDALARVRHGMTDLVTNPAPVLFSMREDYTFGPALTHLGAELMGGQTGTHGGLGAAESLGFATCTADPAPRPWHGKAALRPQQVFAPWRDLVRAGREKRQ